MKFVKTFVSTLIIAALTSHCFAAIYLKVEGIKGEATDKNHKEWIEILSVKGLEPQKKNRDAASGLATAKSQQKTLTITKRPDKSTARLTRSIGDSQFPSTVVLSNNGVTYELTGVSVKSVQKVGKLEQLTLSYSRVEQSTARDYNSSRSNNSSRKANPANHNVTRSNKTIE